MVPRGESADVTQVVHFSAGHRLSSPHLSEAENQRVYGQCFRWHGHNYVVEVTVAGMIDPTTGMAINLGTLEQTVKAAFLDLVDHQDLDEVLPGTITTGEGLTLAFWRRLSATLPLGSLRRVAVEETPKNRFEYAGEMTP